MKALISILIIMGVVYIARTILHEWQGIQKKSGQQTESVAASPPAASSALPGLPPAMEGALAAAQSQGASALKVWLDRNRQFVADPRLGDIELDYVVLVSRQDVSEAKRVFKEVQSRMASDSPLQPRLKRLETNFQ